jgi:hypothetical protein
VEHAAGGHTGEVGTGCKGGGGVGVVAWLGG